MKKTTITYEIAPLVQVEVVHYPRSRYKDIELIIGGEGRKVQKVEILKMFNALSELKKDLKI